ncbi:MAG: biotin-dependent carboxyltransferase family protein [Chitinophagales bacterium]
MAKAHILKAGFYSSIQDMGRFEYAHLGVPVSGAMDMTAFRLANHLLRNNADAACLEITLKGPHVAFEAATQIVVTGAQAEIKINERSIAINQPASVKPGDVLKIGAAHIGVRLYLGIKGGFLTEKVLGSRSFYLGITQQQKLEKGNILHYTENEKPIEPSNAHVQPNRDNVKAQNLKFYPGPEWQQLTQKQQETIKSQTFSISPQQNRMGIQLKESLPNQLNEILTAPVYPGTVQLTPSGKLIILMRDAQVSGGYPRILQMQENSIDVLAQIRAGDSFWFKITG